MAIRFTVPRDANQLKWYVSYLYIGWRGLKCGYLPVPTRCCTQGRGAARRVHSQPATVNDLVRCTSKEWTMQLHLTLSNVARVLGAADGPSSPSKSKDGKRGY
jgi:hypothetical protein